MNIITLQDLIKLAETHDLDPKDCIIVTTNSDKEKLRIVSFSNSRVSDNDLLGAFPVLVLEPGPVGRKG